jgi:Ger(x)C family germination protein
MLALVAAALSGCYDARELDDISRVIAIGIDRGVSDAWRVTVQVPTLQGGGESGSDGSQRDYTTLSIDAPSFFDAVEMLNASMLRQLSFSHAQFLAFSEDLARSGRIGEFVAPIIRFGRIRRTANVFVVRGSAMDFVQANEPVIGTSASKTLESLSKDSEEISYFPEATLESFYEAMKESCRQPSLPLAAVNDMKDFVKDGAPYAGGLMSAGRYLAGELPRQGKNKLELFGTAVFVGDKMVETHHPGLHRRHRRNPRAPAGGRRLLRRSKPQNYADRAPGRRSSFGAEPRPVRAIAAPGHAGGPVQGNRPRGHPGRF